MERTRGRQTTSPAGVAVVDQRTDRDRHLDESLGPTEGLSTGEAAARLERYGPNAIEEHERSAIVELLSHFWAPIPWMIEAALVLTALTERWADFGIIFALLLLNGLVGFWEEHQAAGAIAALKKRLAKRARVLRDESWSTVPAERIVPGDLLQLERGGVVAADGQLLQGIGEVDESVLTGESLSVEKALGGDVYSGTIVVRGSPVARVLATGENTEFGRTAALTGEQQAPSHFQRAILSIGRYLIALALVLVGIIVAVSLLRGEPFSETVEFALVVTIASIPVALPAVLSVTMAVGARYLARHDAIVSHLPVVEEMSGVDVLCADKTGTITKNELALTDVKAFGAIEPKQLLREAALTAESEEVDPIDAAIARALDNEPREGLEVVDLEPFDPKRKRAEARVRDRDGREYRVAKGAVQAIIELAEPGDLADEVQRATAVYANSGYRTLAVARADNGEWRVRGLIAFEDPPRTDSVQTLDQARALGIDVKMVTGDRIEIGREIAREVGMGDEILDSQTLAGLDTSALAHKTEQADGFAGVIPEEKYRIVEGLQANNHIVGMTGDGVNDAPALRRADAGVAVSGATDAARAAADIVLLSPGLSVIIEAIHRAREVFRRMTNYAIYRITETIRIVLFVAVSIVVFDFFPVTPIQIVLLAILNDAAILTIAYDRVQPSPRPERWDLQEVMSIAAVLGLAGVVSSFGVLWIGHIPLDLSDAELRTLLYLKLSVAGHLTLFVARTRGRLWSHRPATVVLVAVVGTQIVATLIAAFGLLMEPLSWPLIALAWGYALIWMLVLDQVKLVVYRLLVNRRHDHYHLRIHAGVTALGAQARRR